MGLYEFHYEFVINHHFKIIRVLMSQNIKHKPYSLYKEF